MAIETFLIEHEAVLRLGSFIGALAVLAAWEVFAPQRPLRRPRSARWAYAAALTILNLVLVRVLFPTAAVVVASTVEQRGSGLMQHWSLPYWIGVSIGVIAFDLAIYLMHLAFHTAPGLWRIHKLHHEDRDVDVATAVRFHPGQAVLSTLVKFAVIALLGTPVLAVVIFETAFHALLLFNHANVRIPPKVDRVLRWFVITPAMHCVHHSVKREEADSNFGFALPWWDRLLGTYRAAPAKGVTSVIFGVIPPQLDEVNHVEGLMHTKRGVSAGALPARDRGPTDMRRAS